MYTISTDLIETTVFKPFLYPCQSKLPLGYIWGIHTEMNSSSGSDSLPEMISRQYKSKDVRVDDKILTLQCKQGDVPLISNTV